MNFNELKKKLNQKKAEKVPNGWYNVHQIAKMSGLSEPRARDFANELAKNGLLERKVFKIFTSRTLVNVTHYREIKGKTKLFKRRKK